MKKGLANCQLRQLVSPFILDRLSTGLVVISCSENSRQECNDN
jgi:hypothetical protein